MIINYDAFPELAATLLDWWESGALAINILGLIVNFFFTMHKGRRYRAAFVTMLVALFVQLYVEVITPATKYIQMDDMILPIVFSTWAYTVWTRAWIYLEYFAQLKGQYDATIEQVLSAENQVIPWKEVAMFSKEMERWQKWAAGALATIFAVGLLYSNVDRIESLQRVSIQSNQIAAQKSQQNHDMAASVKQQQDSLFLIQIVSERKRTERLLVEIGATKDNSVVNQQLLLAERRRNKQLLEYLKGIEESLKSRLDPIPTLKPKSSNWGNSLSPERVGTPPPIRKSRGYGYYSPSEFDTTRMARVRADDY